MSKLLYEYLNIIGKHDKILTKHLGGLEYHYLMLVDRLKILSEAKGKNKFDNTK